MKKINAICVVFAAVLSILNVSCSTNKMEVRRATAANYHAHKTHKIEVRIALPAYEVDEDVQEETSSKVTRIAANNPDVNKVVYVQKFQSFKNVEETAKNWKSASNSWMSDKLGELNPLKVSVAVNAPAINFKGLTSYPWPIGIKMERGLFAIALDPSLNSNWIKPVDEFTLYQVGGKSKAQGEELKTVKSKKGYIFPKFPADNDVAGWRKWWESPDQNLQAKAKDWEEAHGFIFSKPPALPKVEGKKLTPPKIQRKWNIHIRWDLIGLSALIVLALILFGWFFGKISKKQKLKGNRTIVIPARIALEAELELSEKTYANSLRAIEEEDLREKEELRLERIDQARERVIGARKKELQDARDTRKKKRAARRAKWSHRRHRIKKSFTRPFRLIRWKIKKRRILKQVRLENERRRQEVIKKDPTAGYRTSRTVVPDGSPTMKASWGTTEKPIGEDDPAVATNLFAVNDLPVEVFEKAKNLPAMVVLLSNDKYCKRTLPSRNDSTQIVHSQEIGYRLERIARLIREANSSLAKISPTRKKDVYKRITDGVNTIPVSQINPTTGRELILEFVVGQIKVELPDFEMEIPVVKPPQENQASA